MELSVFLGVGIALFGLMRFFSRIERRIIALETQAKADRLAISRLEQEVERLKR